MSLEQLKNDQSYFQHENEIIKNWNEKNIYSLIKKKLENKELFRFCDGPPFVSAKTLHFGHILVSFVKDCIVRYKQMSGNNCLNKIGYDCHGLPLETVAYKLLGLQTSKDVHDMGIDKYNAFCKEIIKKYSGAWNPIFERIGRLVDPDDSYKTLDFNKFLVFFQDYMDLNLLK